MTNPAQLAANRRNAQRSTGPKTHDGKERSARNALKHGSYANRPVAIPRGHFAEDPAEIAEYLDGIIASLGPRDRLEYEHAHRIAIYYLRLRRLTQLEAEDIARHSTTRPHPVDQLLGEIAGPLDTDEQRGRAAGQTLEWPLRTASMIDARTAQALDRALVIYAKLRERTLTSDMDEPVLDVIDVASS